MARINSILRWLDCLALELNQKDSWWIIARANNARPLAVSIWHCLSIKKQPGCFPIIRRFIMKWLWLVA